MVGPFNINYLKIANFDPFETIHDNPSFITNQINMKIFIGRGVKARRAWQ